MKKVDKRDSVKVVTSNNFITAKGLEGMSLKARKLLYVAVSQCRKSDKEFFEFFISVKDFADMMGIDASNVFQEADSLTDELMKTFVSVKGENGFFKYALFRRCEYQNDGYMIFRLNNDMTDFLLQLKGNFTQPLLNDFLKMKSPFSMAIWHLMSREMKSRKPMITDEIKFVLSLEELRSVTGCEDKFKQIGQFKSKVLDKAIREIKDNCYVQVSYRDLKHSRRIVAFEFTAISLYHVDLEDIPQETIDHVNEFINQKKIRKEEGKNMIKVTYEEKKPEPPTTIKVTYLNK